MKAEVAWARSTGRIAVRSLGGSSPRFCAEDWHHSHGWTAKDRQAAINYLCQLTNARVMPDSYIQFHDDWEPWQPKDPITLLGDLVRQEGLTLLVA